MNLDNTSRQSFLGDDSEEILHATRLAIVGLGGGGSHIAQQAAHVGIGRFDLFDPDVMEATNLHRTIGSEPRHAAHGDKKAEVSASLIRRISPRAKIICHTKQWENDHMALRSCDIVIGCVDSFSARDALERYCRRFHVPYIDIGMDVRNAGDGFLISGQVITSLPGGPCMRCLGFLTNDLVSEEIERYGGAGIRPQVVWSNGVLASTAIGIAIRLRCDWAHQTIPPYLEYDGNLNQLRPSARADVARDFSCPHFRTEDGLGDAIWEA